MITEYTHYQIPDQIKKQFLRQFEFLSNLLKANPDCLSFDLMYDDKAVNNDQFLLRITWLSISSFKLSDHHYSYMQITSAYRRFSKKPQYFHRLNFSWNRTKLIPDGYSFSMN